VQKFHMVHALAEWSGQDIKLWADFDECVIGVIEFKDYFHAVYSESLIIAALKEKFALDDNDAQDRLEWMTCSAHGNNDPMIIKEMADGF
jgi:hypothetical protein